MSSVVILHNIRSTHNVGSILRTCEGFGIDRVICSGYTPYPMTPNDKRLPHISAKLTAKIHKSALGAEAIIPIELTNDISSDLMTLKHDGYRIVGLEQAANSQPLENFSAPENYALLLGEEVHGIDSSLIALCDDIVEIKMSGQKESFNVSVSAGIALYQLSYHP